MEDYEKLHRIGSGGQGKIIRVRQRTTGVQYACKMILCHDNYELNFALREIKMLMDLRHEHIISYKDFFLHKDRHSDLHVCLVMELCEQGDISKKIKDTKRRHGKFREARLRKWTGQLAGALAHIHGQDILHRDLKPTNVFFTCEDDVKLGDFGLSTAITANKRRTVVGTPYYFAPELLLQQPYDAKVDMWGLGVVLLELCTLRERPINGQVLSDPKAGAALEAEVLDRGYSAPLAALTRALLAKGPLDRPTALDVVARLGDSDDYHPLPDDANAASDSGDEGSCISEPLFHIPAPPTLPAPCAPPRVPRPLCGPRPPGRRGPSPAPLALKWAPGLPGLQPNPPPTGPVTGGAYATPLGVATARNRILGPPLPEKESIPPQPKYPRTAEAKNVPPPPPPKPKAGPLCVPEAYPTIAAALAVAVAGQEILVGPGLYTDALVIDKAVSITGRGAVCIEVVGSTAVLVTAPKGRLANVTIRQLRTGPPGDASPTGKFVGVDFREGEFALEGCDVESHSGACIAIHTPAANPTVSHCAIHDGRQAGVYVFDGGRGVLEENDIYGNEYAGVLLKRKGAPILRHNKIHHGRDTGIFVCHGASGTMEDNEVYANRGSGVVIKGGGQPTLLRNAIYANRQAGVFCCDRGSGLLQENDIHGNWKAGVLIKTAGAPLVVGNRIHGGREAGVYVFEAGAGCLRDNHIYENQNAGVLVTTGGCPELVGNRIERNKYEGLWVCKRGQCRAEANDLRFNDKGPLDIQAECRPQVTLLDNVS